MGAYRVDTALPPCRLSASDLAQLLRTLAGPLAGQEAPPDITIYSYLPRLCAHGSTLEEYLATKGLPDRVSRLEIRCVCRGPTADLDRSIEITLLPILGRLRIQGPDESWALTARDEVCAILAAHRPWCWRLVGHWVWLGLLLLTSLAGALAASQRAGPLLYAGAAVGLLGLEVAAILDARDQFQPHTEIRMRESTRHFEWRHLAAALSIAGVVLLVVDGAIVLLAR